MPRYDRNISPVTNSTMQLGAEGRANQDIQTLVSIKKSWDSAAVDTALTAAQQRYSNMFFAYITDVSNYVLLDLS